MQNVNIFIVENNKQDLIRTLSNDKLTNNKYFTISELKNELYYRYDPKALLYLMNKYQINYQIAKIYLNNLYYIEHANYQSPKLNNLFYIKQDLLTNNIITINKLFPKFLKSSRVTLIGDFTSYDKDRLLNDLSKITLTTVQESKIYREFTHQIIKCSTLEQEVTFVAEQICELVKKGVDIHKIFITNLNSEYHSCLKRIFPLFNIPINLKETNSIYGTTLAKEFIANLDNNPTEILKNNNSIVGEKLITILNDYAWCQNYQEVKPLIIEDIKHTNLPNEIKKNAVNEIEFKNCHIQDDEYLFLLNFNQGAIPIIHKDEKYLNDQELTELNLLTSIDLNKIEKVTSFNKIKSIKNLIITYKEKTINDTFYISSLNDELNYSVISAPESTYSSSHLYNKIHLTNLLDNYLKYGTKSPTLNKLNTYYSNLPYRVFNNQFKGIDKSKLQDYLANGLTLSYSSMDNYFRCGFRYYLNSILRLNISEDTFMQTIGNIFHEVLEQSFINDNEFEVLWHNAVNKDGVIYNVKEQFFLKKLKEELKFIIDVIESQNKTSLLSSEFHEERIVVNYEGNIKITFKGFIDKVKYGEFNGDTIVAIIDYKTGNPNLNLNNIIYGIEMQLPIYLFLAKHSEKISNVKIAGFYLQKILNNEIIKDNSHSYEELKKKNLMLHGYSNEDTSVLEKFDPTYNDSSIIRSMKTSSKGFYAYSKVLNEKTMNQLTNLVSNKIDEAIAGISNAEFYINPKQVGNTNLGCEFCSYKDICFMQEKNITKLKEYKNLEFLEGGDDNA